MCLIAQNQIHSMGRQWAVMQKLKYIYDDYINLQAIFVEAFTTKLQAPNVLPPFVVACI